jgi:hypothetical protein
VKVEFTLTIFDLGRQLYENKELAAKEKLARDLMKERLALTAEQINGFINRLMPGDHDFLMDKLQRLIDINMAEPRDDVQHWACKCLNTFFEKELPSARGQVPGSANSPDSSARYPSPGSANSPDGSARYLSPGIEDAEAVEISSARYLSPDMGMEKWGDEDTIED